MKRKILKAMFNKVRRDKRTKNRATYISEFNTTVTDTVTSVTALPTTYSSPGEVIIAKKKVVKKKRSLDF